MHTGMFRRLLSTIPSAIPLAFWITILAWPGLAPAADFTARQLTEKVYKARPGDRLDFSGKDLSFLDLAGLDFKQASLAHSNLHGVDLTKANLQGADLAGVTLDRAIVVKANFSGANLEGASMLRPSVYTTLAFNRADAPKFAGARLKGIRITARLDGADFRGADLSGARLGPHEPRADLSSLPATVMQGCDFSGAILTGADLTWAKLMFSKFVGADLRYVSLIGADLSRVDLSGADLTGANITDADFDGAIIAGVKGLDTAIGRDSIKNYDRAVH